MLSATFRGDERFLVPAYTLQLKTEKAKQGKMQYVPLK